MFLYFAVSIRWIIQKVLSYVHCQNAILLSTYVFHQSTHVIENGINNMMMNNDTYCILSG